MVIFCGMIFLNIILLKKLWILWLILVVSFKVVLYIVSKMFLKVNWLFGCCIICWIMLIIWVNFFIVKYLY